VDDGAGDGAWPPRVPPGGSPIASPAPPSGAAGIPPRAMAWTVAVGRRVAVGRCIPVEARVGVGGATVWVGRMECEPGGGPCGGTSVGSGTASAKCSRTFSRASRWTV
jgi:hypothetical protein